MALYQSKGECPALSDIVCIGRILLSQALLFSAMPGALVPHEQGFLGARGDIHRFLFQAIFFLRTEPYSTRYCVIEEFISFSMKKENSVFQKT